MRQDKDQIYYQSTNRSCLSLPFSAMSFRRAPAAPATINHGDEIRNTIEHAKLANVAFMQSNGLGTYTQDIAAFSTNDVNMQKTKPFILEFKQSYNMSPDPFAMTSVKLYGGNPISNLNDLRLALKPFEGIFKDDGWALVEGTGRKYTVCTDPDESYAKWEFTKKIEAQAGSGVPPMWMLPYNTTDMMQFLKTAFKLNPAATEIKTDLMGTPYTLVVHENQQDGDDYKKMSFKMMP